MVHSIGVLVMNVMGNVTIPITQSIVFNSKNDLSNTLYPVFFNVFAVKIYLTIVYTYLQINQFCVGATYP